MSVPTTLSAYSRADNFSVVASKTESKYTNIGSALAGYSLELATWPDGGLRASIGDVTKLLLMLVNDGNIRSTDQQLNSAASLNEMKNG